MSQCGASDALFQGLETQEQMRVWRIDVLISRSAADRILRSRSLGNLLVQATSTTNNLLRCMSASLAQSRRAEG